MRLYFQFSTYCILYSRSTLSGCEHYLVLLHAQILAADGMYDDYIIVIIIFS